MACLDECCSLCTDNFIEDLKKLVHDQAKEVNLSSPAELPVAKADK